MQHIVTTVTAATDSIRCSKKHEDKPQVVGICNVYEKEACRLGNTRGSTGEQAGQGATGKCSTRIGGHKQPQNTEQVDRRTGQSKKKEKGQDGLSQKLIGL